MLLRNTYNTLPSFKYMVDNLNIQSPITLKHLLDTPFCSDSTYINDTYDKIETLFNIIKRNNKIISDFGMKLCQVRDIDGTLANIGNNTILGDIELFEVKSFCILSNEIRNIYNSLNIAIVNFPNLSETVEILDPDHTNIPSFYIYDSYSEELAAIRKKIRIAVADKDRDKEEQLRFEEGVKEDEIRAVLSQKLKQHVKPIREAINAIVELDILLAKAEQAFDCNLTRPDIVGKDNPTSFVGLFNPMIAGALEEKALKFQPIDITLYKKPCLITGANMSGKTVLLKTIAMAQYLTQYGFFVPASKASVSMVDAIAICMDENDNDMKGLSSFAAEILKVNEIVSQVNNGINALVLIDELARTTNPVEGKKIVSATLNFLDRHNIRGLISSHYSDISYPTRRLRVKGLTSIPKGITLTINNINMYIDYSLTEIYDDDVPQEALRIAELLGVDKEFIKLCEDS